MEKQVRSKGDKAIIVNYYSSTLSAHRRVENTYQIYALFTMKTVKNGYLVVQIREMTFANGCFRSTGATKERGLCEEIEGKYFPVQTEQTRLIRNLLYIFWFI